MSNNKRSLIKSIEDMFEVLSYEEIAKICEGKNCADVFWKDVLMTKDPQFFNYIESKILDLRSEDFESKILDLRSEDFESLVLVDNISVEELVAEIINLGKIDFSEYDILNYTFSETNMMSMFNVFKDRKYHATMPLIRDIIHYGFINIMIIYISDPYFNLNMRGIMVGGGMRIMDTAVIESNIEIFKLMLEELNSRLRDGKDQVKYVLYTSDYDDHNYFPSEDAYKYISYEMWEYLAKHVPIQSESYEEILSHADDNDDRYFINFMENLDFDILYTASYKIYTSKNYPKR